MPYFTNNWFQQAIPKWQEILVPIFAGKPNLRFLEIGSYEGQSALWTADNLLTGLHCHLVCIDPFVGAEGEGGLDPSVLYERFLFNIRDHENRIGIFNETSKEFFYYKHSPFNEWDMVYIDGSHLAKDVLFDITNAWPQIKDGGVMVMDDYGPVDNLFLRPRPAIDAFLVCYQDEYRLLDMDYQVIVLKEKRSVDDILAKTHSSGVFTDVWT